MRHLLIYLIAVIVILCCLAPFASAQDSEIVTVYRDVPTVQYVPTYRWVPFWGWVYDGQVAQQSITTVATTMAVPRQQVQIRRSDDSCGCGCVDCRCGPDCRCGDRSRARTNGTQAPPSVGARTKQSKLVRK